MPTVVCPGCGRRIGIPDDEMHLAVECARCDTRFKPSDLIRPPERVRLTCPNCQAGIRVPSSMMGKRISCPKCLQAFEAVREEETGTVTTSCPGCGRAIALQSKDLSLTVVCVRCNTHFNPVTGERVEPPLQAGDEPEPAYVPPSAPSYTTGSRLGTTPVLLAILGAAAAMMLLVLIIAVGSSGKDSKQAMAGMIVLLIVLPFVIAAYFLPTFIAFFRNHPQRFAIAMLNIFAGWTFIAWAASVVWALTAIDAKEHVHHHYHH